jgi:hypothetical protein
MRIVERPSIEQDLISSGRRDARAKPAGSGG